MSIHKIDYFLDFGSGTIAVKMGKQYVAVRLLMLLWGETAAVLRRLMALAMRTTSNP